MSNDESPKSLLWRIENGCGNIEKQIVWAHHHSMLFYLLILSFGFSLVTPFSLLCLLVSFHSLRGLYLEQLPVGGRKEVWNGRDEKLEELEDYVLVNSVKEPEEPPGLEELPELKKPEEPEEHEEPEEPIEPEYHEELKEQLNPNQPLQLQPQAPPPAPNPNPPHNLQDTEAVEAYQIIGCGYRLITSHGPKQHRTYRVTPAASCPIPWSIEQVPRIKPYEGRRERPKIIGVAYQDPEPGHQRLNPDLYTSPRLGRNMPVTYVKLQWSDGAVSWETRSDVRKVFGRRAADGLLFSCAQRFELEAKDFAKVETAAGSRRSERRVR